MTEEVTKEKDDDEVPKNHYINNKEFLAALIAYQADIQEAEDNGNPKPFVTDYIAKCFLQIAQRLSFRPNFINYTYKDDMISDGLENCLAYMHNFNPEKSNNPFAYFTQIIYYAFLRRIQKEKKHMYTKYKYFDKMGGFETMESLQDHDKHSFDFLTQTAGGDEFHIHIKEFIDEMERKEDEKKKARIKKQNERAGLDCIMIPDEK